MKIKLGYILFLIVAFTLMINAQGKKKAKQPEPVDKYKYNFNYDYTLGIGFSTYNILFNNINARTFNPLFVSQADNKYGGSFNGAQPGIDIRFTKQIDDEGRWRMPIGLDMTFLDAYDRVSVSRSLNFYYQNSLNIYSLYSGIYYHFLQIDRAKASMYAGAEIRGNFLTAPELEINRIYTNSPADNENRIVIDKKDAFRLGAQFKLGIEGELVDDYILNISGGIGFSNALLKDNARGELMTPFNNSSVRESGETYLPTFIFTLMIQYKL